jgi:hypothetical protein
MYGSLWISLFLIIRFKKKKTHTHTHGFMDLSEEFRIFFLSDGRRINLNIQTTWVMGIIISSVQRLSQFRKIFKNSSYRLLRPFGLLLSLALVMYVANRPYKYRHKCVTGILKFEIWKNGDRMKQKCYIDVIILIPEECVKCQVARRVSSQ